jgi:type IX secretion system PorP/SprF family membrane protein
MLPLKSVKEIARAAKSLFLACVLFLSLGRAYGQTDVQLSQQMFSRINYNPAASGLSEDIYLYMLARQQWAGFRNAPQTIVLNGHTFVPWTQSGWGFSIIGDMLGFEKSVNPKIRYAYHIPFMASRSSLSLGIGVGVMYKTLDFDKATYENPAEPDRGFGKMSATRPDFDFGVEYNAKYYQLGASVTHLGNKTDKLQNTESAPHFYAYGRGMFDLNPQWQLTPALSWHNTVNLHQIEANLTVFMKKRFWFGASYRMRDCAVFLAGAYITPEIMLGYSYDYSTTDMKSYQTGTHEIMLSWRILQPNKSKKATRMRECYHSWW